MRRRENAGGSPGQGAAVVDQLHDHRLDLRCLLVDDYLEVVLDLIGRGTFRSTLADPVR